MMFGKSDRAAWGLSSLLRRRPVVNVKVRTSQRQQRSHGDKGFFLGFFFSGGNVSNYRGLIHALVRTIVPPVHSVVVPA